MNSTLNASGITSVILGLLKLMRPKQWIKNVFVLAPLVFTGQFMEWSSVSDAILVFVLFCLASSATYIINDYHDIEQDRKHPKKSKSRPLASGQITKPQAIGLLLVLYVFLVFGWTQEPTAIYVILAYSGLNLLYTFILKHQPVVDIFTIAIGFVLRVMAGAMALSVPLSSWMFVTTLCLALYLAAVKRRQELKNSGSEGRKVLEHYSVELVDKYAEMSATGALLFYSLFVMTTHPKMVLTIPFVLFGLFRYWFVVETKDAGESPTDALYSDWQLVVTIVLWIAACSWAMLQGDNLLFGEGWWT